MWNQSKRMGFLFLAVFILLFILTAPTPIPAKELWEEEFLLPYIAAITGAEGPWTKECNEGLQMGLAEINSKGGIAGRKVVLKTYDCASKPAEAAVRVRAAAPGSLIVFGPPTSTSGSVGGRAAVSMKVPWFGGGAAAASWCTNPEMRPWVWTQIMGNEEIGAAAANFLVPMLPAMKKVFWIRDVKEKSAIGQWEGADKELRRLGIEITGSATTSLGDVDFTAQATKAIAAKADAIWLSAYINEAGGVIKELRKQGWRGLICGVQSPMTHELTRVAGVENLAGVLTVMDYFYDAPQPPEVRIFAKAFKQKYGYSPGLAASIWYDMPFVFKDIFEKQNLTNNPAKLEEERLKFIKAMDGKRWNGANGSFYWEKDGRIIKKAHPLIWGKDGELHLYTK